MVIQASQNGKIVEGASRLFIDGLFLIDNIKVSYDFVGVVTIQIIDNQGRFLSKSVDVIIPVLSDNLTQVSAGEIRLLSGDGLFCTREDARCIHNEVILKGDVTVPIDLGLFPSIGLHQGLNQSYAVKVLKGFVL